MLTTRPAPTFILPVLAFLVAACPLTSADEFDQFVKPLLTDKCAKCHSAKEAKGEVDFSQITSADQFRAQPELIEQVFEAIDSSVMPPDDESQLDNAARIKLLATLKTLLQEATAGAAARQPPRRLNRFQYNNVIRDLFQLKKNIFPLSEKLLTRHANYLQTGQPMMPDAVEVFSHALDPENGFEDVVRYPKDLRASHGFDNQANQLTLSPLLLDAYLRLSLSIVESPEFTQDNVGVWQTFFAEPAEETDIKGEVRRRLAPFLQQAFRASVDSATVDRYTEYTAEKLERGLSFTESMKKAAAAILCSPKFLFRCDAEMADEKTYELASRLSFFLWGSAPDEQLLSLAKSGELSKPHTLNATINRMLADPKIERFLDTFPAQWMQLENLFGVAPDPKLYPQYNLEGGVPASVQMVVEPLLLFDAVFVENRPIIELIKPTFAYRSDFLEAWYSGELRPGKEFHEQVAEELRLREEKRTTLSQKIADVQEKHNKLSEAIRERVLAAKRRKQSGPEGNAAPADLPDLKPYAVWEFSDNLSDSVGSLDLRADGSITYNDGRVVLNGAFLESPKLPIELRAKTLEVWCRLNELNQRGGGVMTVQWRSRFDSIVYGERKPMEWISGSDGHARTLDFEGAAPESKAQETLHLVMVYTEDGTTTLYRNGSPYAASYNKGATTFPAEESHVLFGLRHLPAGGNRFLSVEIDRARFYNRALTSEEVTIAGEGEFLSVSEQEIAEATSPEEQTELLAVATAREEAEQELQKLPKHDPNRPIDVDREVQARFNRSLIAKANSRSFRRVPVEDPRYGGIITNAATLTMTSAPTRTLPIARGAWMIEVIFNDPPPPPPNDVPPLDEEDGPENLTIREKFAKHRENPDCAGCHARIDPLGFALENFDITGRWRDKYENNRSVDATGTLLKKYDFTNIVELKDVLVKEDKRFARAFTAHLLRFALARELTPGDSLIVDDILNKTEADDFRLRSIIRQVILSNAFTNL